MSDPKKSTEQILAIYPIISGQKASSANAIPPRSTENKAVPPQSNHDDPIDFGQDDSPAEPQRPPVRGDPKVESTGEISELLNSTGKPSEGPLIDFHHDLKKNIPSIQRSDTTGSNDVFVDAKE